MALDIANSDATVRLLVSFYIVATDDTRFTLHSTLKKPEPLGLLLVTKVSLEKTVIRLPYTGIFSSVISLSFYLTLHQGLGLLE